MRTLLMFLAATAAATGFCQPNEVHASHNSPLHLAACEYRDATREFQRAVNRSRYFDHYAERMTDRLGDAADRLAGRAPISQHSEHFEQMLLEWVQVRYLQPRVEAIVFANPQCPSRVDLLPCWRRVTCAQTDLARLIEPLFALPPAPVVVARPAAFQEFCPLTGAPIPRAAAPRYGVPGFPAPFPATPGATVPGYGVPGSGLPVDPAIPGPRTPDIREVPDYQVPNLTDPAVVPPQPAGVQGWRRGELSPYWNVGHRAAPNVDSRRGPVYTRRGIDAREIGALISRLLD